MRLTITSYAQTPVALTIADGSSTPPYAVMADQINWGNATFDHAYSGPRGTQGRRPAAGLVQNRTVTLPLRVYGSSKDNLAVNIKNLATVADSVRQFGGRLTWQSSGQSYRQHLEIQCTDGIDLAGWNNRAENRSIAAVNLTLACAPYALGDSLDVDDTSFASLSDYTLDNGLVGNLSASTGALKATASTTTQFQLVHTQRGYTLGDSEVTVTGTYAQAALFTLGAIFWRTDANNYWVAYIQDTGSAATLKIDQTTAGTTTNRASATPTRPTAASTVYIRVRSEGTSVRAEHWSSAPTPMGTPATTATCTASTTQTGKAGLIFNPQSTTPSVSRLTVRPFTYGSRSQPAQVTLSGVVPGDVPALARVEITTKQALAWAAVAWQATPAATTLSSSPLPRAAFTVFNGNDDVSANRVGWSTVDATNNTIYTTTAAAASSYSCRYSLDPSLLPTDAYADGDRAVEAWALILTDSSNKVVAPTLTASLVPASGPGPTRYTDEGGSAGMSAPTLASTATTAGYRWTRLGTLHIPLNGAREMHLVIAGQVTASSTGTGTFGIARVVLAPVRQRASLPTGKTADSTYPVWTASTVETVKTIESDLTTSVAQPSVSTVAVGDRSVGGSLLELPQGNIDMLTMLSAIVPDDSASSTATEYLTAGSPTATTVPQAAMHIGVTPRFSQLRS